MSLAGHLNGFFAGPRRTKRAAPSSTLVAVWPDGKEAIIERRRNAGRTIYCLGQQSSSVLGDLVNGLGARIERR
jgi:hypothetical protein